jgi:hypothetical protein
MFFLSEQMWEFKKSYLINLVNETPVRADKTGYLVVTVMNKQLGLEQNGTVCDEYLNKKSAKLFCRELGFITGWWERDSKKKENFQ